jgi:hypothetical protein
VASTAQLGNSFTSGNKLRSSLSAEAEEPTPVFSSGSYKILIAEEAMGHDDGRYGGKGEPTSAEISVFPAFSVQGVEF